METLTFSPREVRFMDRKFDGLLRRYGIPEETDECLESLIQNNGIEASFFVKLAQAYIDPDSVQIENFQAFSVPVLVDYLRRSHTYYLNDRLPKMGQYIHQLLANYPQGHPLLRIMGNFFTPYCQHLEKHIEEEETNLFPYALDLHQNVQRESPYPSILMSAYSVLDFAQHHDDTEDELQKVRNLIARYDPPRTNKSPYRMLSNLLRHFEEDLQIHALIEDKVLVPKLWKLETEWAERLQIK